MQPLDLPAERRGGTSVDRLPQTVLRVLAGTALLPVQAQVVAAALEDGERRLLAEQRGQGGDQARQVTVDELALQRDRGRGYHDGAAGGYRVQDRRDQVGQGLPGAGAGLHGQVLAGLDGLPYRLGHLDLARPFRAADAGDGGGEEFGDRGKILRIRAGC